MPRTKRRAHDFYATPEHYVRQILPLVPKNASVLEPCVGDGAIARFFGNGKCQTNDIDPKRSAEYHYDAREQDLWYHIGCVDWVITNPPFRDAFEIVQWAVGIGGQTAMLLRLSFFEPTRERESWLVQNPPSGLIYLPRYSFTGNGKSDSTTCVWGIWGYTLDPPIQIAPRFPTQDD